MGAHVADGKEAWVPDLKTEVTLLGEYDTIAGGELYSDDGNHILHIASSSGQRRVWLDGRIAPGCGEISPADIALSADGQCFVCVGREGRETVVVVNGKRIPAARAVQGPPVVSREGGHWACVCWIDRKYQVCHDGRLGTPYDSISSRTISFSPDGKRLAYVASSSRPGNMMDSQEYFVLDGRGGPAFKSIAETCYFSADGKHVAYIANSGEKTHIVVDGQVGKPFPHMNVMAFRFSPDGTHWYCSAYPMKSGGHGAVLIVDGELISEATGHNYETMVISPDRHLWYFSNSNKKYMLDHKAYEDPSGLKCTRPSYSPDGKRLALIAEDDQKRQLVIVDGKLGPAFTKIAKPGVLFSPDGARAAYVAEKGVGAMVAVIDDYISHRYAAILDGSLVFSRDGKRVGFVGRKSNYKNGAWVDGEPGPDYPFVGPRSLVFSADSRSVAYTVATGPRPGPKTRREFVVVNGEPGPEFDALPETLYKNGPAFREDGSLEYLGMRGKKLYRVRHALTTGGWQ